MDETDIEELPDLNCDKKWLEIDLFDLANSVRLNNPIEEIARFRCRSRREVRQKIAELERSGELEEAAAKAVPEEPPDDARPE